MKMLNCIKKMSFCQGRFVVVLAMVLFLAHPVSAQETQQKEQKSPPRMVFTVVEKQPEFPGGTKEMAKFLESNIQYPAAAREARVHGKVFISFIILDDGDVSDIKVTKGIGHGCDEEAVRVASMMPKWTPGKQNGRPVAVKYNTVVNFKKQ